ncbi:hypothetical protein ABFV83_15130 [Lacrimispora sp. BS-2]|uniref:AraC family transcriptional regulator n=1 Tax=Lacrimispora sp. BS-2 TaxID=3151850 RepID=A0AAU7PLP0_9FIRM
MIEILNGIHETIHYECPLGFRLYHNTNFEDYPEHWHGGIEMIMPTKGGYEAIIGEERLPFKGDGDPAAHDPSSYF